MIPAVKMQTGCKRFLTRSFSFVRLSDNPLLLKQKNGRGGKIRTCDPLFPKQVRYQAALRPEQAWVLYKNARRASPVSHYSQLVLKKS